MKNRKKWGIFGLGVIASTALLVSFTIDPIDGKKKKYQVIHHENQETVTYDTIISMDSKYTVEQFLADKGIDSKRVEIINLPNGANQFGEMLHRKEVNVSCIIDEDGTKITKKFVNGEEVEMTPEELEELESHDARDGEYRVVIKRGGNPEGEFKKMDNHDVQIRVEVDDQGNKTITKTENGKEVKLTPEELKELESHHSDNREHRIVIKHDESHDDGLQILDEQHLEIRVEVDDQGNKTITKMVNGEEVEITEEELENLNAVGDQEGHEMRIFIEDGNIMELEGMTKEMELKISKMMEDLESGIGEHEIVIKMMTDSENFEDIDMEFSEDGENGFEWISDDETDRIKWMTTDEGEDFTLVLVTENFDEADQVERKMEINTSKQSFEAFPNPTDGTITVRFIQDTKAKTDVKIADANGKIVFEEKLGKFSGTYEKEVNLKKFGAGTYLISIEKNGKVETKKVIVK